MKYHDTIAHRPFHLAMPPTLGMSSKSRSRARPTSGGSAPTHGLIAIEFTGLSLHVCTGMARESGPLFPDRSMISAVEGWSHFLTESLAKAPRTAPPRIAPPATPKSPTTTPACRWRVWAGSWRGCRCTIARRKRGSEKKKKSTRTSPGARDQWPVIQPIPAANEVVLSSRAHLCFPRHPIPGADYDSERGVHGGHPRLRSRCSPPRPLCFP
jgi:hypothetical protein